MTTVNRTATIVNYTNNCRTNLLDVDYGPSNITYIRDSAHNKITDFTVDNLLFFGSNSSEYVDTNWVPRYTSPFTIELVLPLRSSAEYEGATNCFVGSDGSNLAYGLFGYSTSTTTVADGEFHHVTLAFDGNTTVKVYDNSVLVSTYSSLVPEEIAHSLHLGNSITGLSGSIKAYEGRALLEYEIIRDYDLAVEAYTMYLRDSSGDFISDDNGDKIITEYLLKPRS